MYKACFTAFDYSVPDKWYEGLYTDLAPVRKSARSFRIVHENRPAECWLLIHGYRGYPGEMVRPATDLYEEGFDVFVPRLPGHGTSGNDFIRTGSSDWMGVVEKAVGKHPHEHLVICPGKDRIISIPSLKLYRKAVRGNENVVMVENGTHCIMYDKDPDAEEKAIRAIVDFARGECENPCKRQDTEEGHKLE